MQLTRHTDYAFRVLIYLGLRDGATATVAEIAAFHQLSHAHLNKIVQHLASGGFVVAKRGRGGGVLLARAPDEINLAAVTRALEPGFEVVECMRDASRCRVEGPCALQGILARAVERFVDELAQHTLADLLLPTVGLLAPAALARER